MKPKRVLIIGGVAGGATAAARLRRMDEQAEIVIFERTNYISYANCGLPYYIGGVIAEKDKLLLQTPEKMKERYNVDVRVRTEVTEILPEKKQIKVCDLNTGESSWESYDSLILAPGAAPVIPGIEGSDSDRILTLRSAEDAFRIKELVVASGLKNVLIVGAGYVGMELAENLSGCKIEVSVVEREDHLVGVLDKDMSVYLLREMEKAGVHVYLGDAVSKVSSASNGADVTLQSGKTLKSDLVLMCVGVRPETVLAKKAGIALGEKGGILADQYMATSVPDIYVAGDAVEITDYVTGKSSLIPLAGPANKEGRIAADSICGRKHAFCGSNGTAILQAFGMTVAVTGKTEKALLAANIKYKKSYTHSASHATYYPGSSMIHMKLIFDPETGKILGAQAAGQQGVDRRIDVISTAIYAGLTVYDLENLDLAYAPMFSSAKDPANIAGYVASNILRGDMKAFYWDEVEKIPENNGIMLDVRTEKEFAAGTFPHAINIPVDTLRTRLSEIPKDKTIYVACQIGLRGYIACRILMQNGFSDVRNLSGGYLTYSINQN